MSPAQAEREQDGDVAHAANADQKKQVAQAHEGGFGEPVGGVALQVEQYGSEGGVGEQHPQEKPERAGFQRDAFAAQEVKEQAHVGQRGEAAGGGKPNVRVVAAQDEGEDDVEQHRADACLDRGFGVMAGVEGGGEDFHHDVKERADAVGAQAEGGHFDVVRVKAAAVEEAGDDGRGKDYQANRSGAADEKAPSQRPVQRAHELRVVVGGAQRAEARQYYRAEGDANQPDRQFDQAVRVVKPGDAACYQPRGEVGVNQHGQLADR